MVLASFSWVLNILNVETVIRGAVPCAVPLSQVDSRPDQGVSQARTHKYIGKPRERFLNLKKQVIFLLFYFKVKNLNINYYKAYSLHHKYNLH